MLSGMILSYVGKIAGCIDGGSGDGVRDDNDDVGSQRCSYGHFSGPLRSFPQ